MTNRPDKPNLSKPQSPASKITRGLSDSKSENRGLAHGSKTGQPTPIPSAQGFGTLGSQGKGLPPSAEALRAHFTAEMNRHGLLTKYIDIATEATILEQVVRDGAPLNTARAVFLETANHAKFVLESNVMERVTGYLRSYGADGKVDQGLYKLTVSLCVNLSADLRSEYDCQRLVIRAIETEGLKIKTSPFSFLIGNWFTKEKKRLKLT